MAKPCKRPQDANSGSDPVYELKGKFIIKSKSYSIILISSWWFILDYRFQKGARI